MDDPILVEVTRGGQVESRHRGAVSVVDAEGTAVLALGDVECRVFPRSAVKALQALPLVEGGFADSYGLSDAEIALACASHSGEPEHVATAAAMLEKAGQTPDCLECGAHWPSNDDAARALAAAGKTPTVLHNNCSGKHSGFVCLACGLGEAPKGYVRPEHPVQRAVAAALEDITGASHTADVRGTDGCSIPTYAVPLPALAFGFAKFGAGVGLSKGCVRAAERIRAAVAAHPFMVAGTGRFDTRIMERFGQRVFVKTGAEGVHCAALPDLGYGIAVKCDDGAKRAAEAVMASLLLRLLEIDDEERAFLSGFARRPLRNWNGTTVGEVRPAEALAA
ncbi:MAG TPA: asparaginase [Beijerinckiaceae bacterium]|jgi:L-asparaginase II